MGQPLTDTALQAQAAIASVGGVVGVAVSDPTVYWLGVPMPVVMASFAGSAVALSFLGSLGRMRALTIVACCTLIGAYLQPLFGHWFGIPSGIWPASGFASGLMAHVTGTAVFGEVPGAVGQLKDAMIERYRNRGKP